MSATLDFRDWTDSGETPAEESRDARHGPWLAIAAVLGGLAAGCSAHVLKLAFPAPSAIVHVSIGDARLALPPDLLRTPVPDGPQARIDLLLSWPDLGPVARRVASARQSWGRQSWTTPPLTTGDEVQVTLSPSDDAPAPETRVSQLYARFLEPQVLQGPGDLLTRHFKRNSPYAGELLIFSPPDGRKLAARCESEPFRIEPALQGGDAVSGVEIPATCLAEFRRRGLDVQLRFPPRLAGGLDAVHRRLIALVDRIAG
jgi:hypothetical protein